MALPPGLAAILVLLVTLVCMAVCILIMWHLFRRGLIKGKARLAHQRSLQRSRRGHDSALEDGTHRRGAHTPTSSEVIFPPPVYLNTLRSKERLLLYGTAPPHYTPPHSAANLGDAQPELPS